MKKYILLAAILAVPNISFAVAENGGFSNMNCTQAVTWAASQIATPPPPHFSQKEWNKFIGNGGAETVSISILSSLPGSPCFKSLLEKNPASGVADGKNRGVRSAP